jgi:predicted P-loop ATPase
MASAISIKTADWRERLKEYGKPPRPKPNLDNCLVALEHCPSWSDVLVYNEFAHEISIACPPPWGGQGNRPWSDNDDRLATRWFQQQDIQINVSTAIDAIKTRSHACTINPLLDFLNNLEWDRTMRVDTWLRDYMGVIFNDYSCAVGRKWLISAVARAFQPGCKADHCLILEGEQGIGKSTALRELAGPELFTDYVSENLGSKEASILCMGTWIVEFSELEALIGKHAKMETIKAFISRTEDRYRPHYARHPIRVDRQCIFAATTNKEIYLLDDSGNRRFWPVKCKQIDTWGISRDREQIWAEAVYLYLDGQKWHLDAREEELARREQANRYDYDPWQDDIERWIAGKLDVAVGEILESALHKDNQTWVRADQMRVAKCLAHIGWKQYRVGHGGARRYRPPQTTPK